MPAAESDGFTVSSGEIDGLVMLTVSGELDLATAPSLMAAVTELASAGGPPAVIDLSHVTFCDSSGLGALIAARQLLPAENSLVLRQPSASVRKLLALTGMTRMFTIED